MVLNMMAAQALAQAANSWAQVVVQALVVFLLKVVAEVRTLSEMCWDSAQASPRRKYILGTCQLDQVKV